MISQTELNSLIKLHEEFLETNGEHGERLDLEGVSFKELDFQEGNLSKSSLKGCKFEKCCLKNVNFSEADIGSLLMEECEAQRCSFEKARLNNTFFVSNKMQGCSFFCSNIWKCIFRKNNLERSVFSSISATEEEKKTNLNFLFADYNNFDLSTFKNTIFYNTNNLRDCSFKNCNFDNCSFNGINFAGCDLTGISMQEAFFTECSFLKAKTEALDFGQCFLIDCLGNNKEIITVQSHLFTCTIIKNQMYVGLLFNSQKKWFETPDEEIVEQLWIFNQEIPKEDLSKWWIIWKPILKKIADFS